MGNGRVNSAKGRMRGGLMLELTGLWSGLTLRLLVNSSKGVMVKVWLNVGVNLVKG